MVNAQYFVSWKSLNDHSIQALLNSDENIAFQHFSETDKNFGLPFWTLFWVFSMKRILLLDMYCCFYRNVFIECNFKINVSEILFCLYLACVNFFRYSIWPISVLDGFLKLLVRNNGCLYRFCVEFE